MKEINLNRSAKGLQPVEICFMFSLLLHLEKEKKYIQVFGDIIEKVLQRESDLLAGKRQMQKYNIEDPGLFICPRRSLQYDNLRIAIQKVARG